MIGLNKTGPIVVLTSCLMPSALCRIGAARLEIWLRNRRVAGADRLTEMAVQATDDCSAEIAVGTVMGKHK